MFNFTYKDIDKNFETNLIWEHNIINLTWIIAFCIDMWINIKNTKGVAGIRAVPRLLGLCYEFWMAIDAYYIFKKL